MRVRCAAASMGAGLARAPYGPGALDTAPAGRQHLYFAASLNLPRLQRRDRLGAQFALECPAGGGAGQRARGGADVAGDFEAGEVFAEEVLQLAEVERRIGVERGAHLLAQAL